MAPCKLLVMTLQVNHWEARFIFVLSQQTAECHSSSSAGATYIPAGCFWLPAIVPSWHKVNKGTASNTDLPLDIRHTYPVHRHAFPRLPHGSAPKSPSTASSISCSHTRGFVVSKWSSPWACCWGTPHPTAFVSLSGVLQPLACSQLWSPTLLMDEPAAGNVQYFIHCDTDTVQRLAGSLQHGYRSAPFHLSWLWLPNSYFC